MAENPTGRSMSGSSLTRKGASKVVLGTLPPKAEAEAVRAALRAASGGVQDRLQVILDAFNPTLAESYRHQMTAEELRDPTPRHGAYAHPDERWYQAEIATLLGKILHGADASMRIALATAFRAGELFKEMDLEEAGKRLDKAVVQRASVVAQGSAAATEARTKTARLYAPALAEAERRWRGGSRASASQMSSDLIRRTEFAGLSGGALRRRLGPVRKKFGGDHSVSAK
jgi:hypothetical protein